MDLARSQGVSKTAVSLGVSYYGLRKRLEGGDGERIASPGRGARNFVEMLPWPMGTVAECVLELTDRDGTRLKIEVPRGVRGEIESLVRALWRGTRCSR